jgi:hypothetical protein
MNNNQKNPAYGLVWGSQLIIVALGAAGIWLSNASRPAAHIHWIAACILGVLLALITFGIFFGLYRGGGRFAQTLLNDLQRVWGLFSGYSWWRIICVAALAGLGEELLFRGFFQSWINSYLAISWAILLASLVFAALHYLSHAYFICAVLMSIAFGIGYYLTGSLLMVIIWHGVYDLIALGIIIKFPHIIGIIGK